MTINKQVFRFLAGAVLFSACLYSGIWLAAEVQPRPVHPANDIQSFLELSQVLLVASAISLGVAFTIWIGALALAQLSPRIRDMFFYSLVSVGILFTALGCTKDDEVLQGDFCECTPEARDTWSEVCTAVCGPLIN